MAWLHLQQVSISLLAQSILALVITLYFFSLKGKSTLTWLMTASFAGFAFESITAGLANSLNSSLSWQFYATELEPLGLLFGMIALLQFAYRFPELVPGLRLEAKIVLFVSIVLALLGLGVVGIELSQFGEIPSLPPVLIFTGVQLLWVVIVLLRQTIHLSRLDGFGGKQGRLQSLMSLISPPNRPARATRAFALTFIFAIVLTALSILADLDILLTWDVTRIIVAPGLLVFLYVFCLTYLNYTSESHTFMVKLVGASLVILLAVLGTTGFLIVPFYEAAYRNTTFLTDNQTLRFEPNSSGGYDVGVVPFRFETDLGQNLNLGNEHNATVELDFVFEFFDHTWTTAYVSDNGLITFAGPFDPVAFRYRRQPVIAPMAVDLDPTDGGGVFAKSETERLTITWHQVRQMGSSRANTIQLTLYPAGSFEFTYNGLNMDQTYDNFYSLQAPWLVGALPGILQTAPTELRFRSALPYSGPSSGGLVEDYYADFRSYVSQRIAPLAILILVGSAIILGGFPIFFQTSLVKPLTTLVEGVKQVNTGNLEIAVPVQFSDEIGFLTRSFNRMVRSLNELFVIQKELDIARRIQQSLLPQPTLDWPGPDTVCYSAAASEVGGDFYAYYVAHASDGRERYRIAVGDVSGKGMPAALLMSVSLASFQATVVQAAPPAQILRHLDQAIYVSTRNTRQNCAMVCLEFAPLNTSTAGNNWENVPWRLRVANAGCIAPLVRTAEGSVIWLDVGGLPLGTGVTRPVAYEECVLELSKGDFVILISDGVVEAGNDANELFGFERLARAVAIGPTTSPQAMLDHLKQTMAEFVAGTEPSDDRTIVVLRA